MIDINFTKSEAWSEIYSAAEKTVKENKMDRLINGGVVVGFSGGADSVTLLLFLAEYRKRHGSFPLAALHVNHMIRGDEADRDESFSRQICEFLDISFFCEKINVPQLSKEAHKGLEEAARDARYKCFEKFISTHAEYNSIATAHNATDNLETVIFNMMRGAGINGISGISAVRENIIRPLIAVSSAQIRNFLTETGIDFAVDSTNLSNEYSRNYIRHEIIPKLSHLSPMPERMASRLSSNLSIDADYIDSAVDEFMARCYLNGTISALDMRSLHKAIQFRVISEMVSRYKESNSKSRGDFSVPERAHIDVISSKLSDGDFSYCLPGGVSFVSKNGKCFISNSKKSVDLPEKIKLHKLSLGLNVLDGFSTAIFISESKEDLNCLNVYKIAIQKSIPFDIINGSLCVRSRQDGDSYKYGGITHKIKKLFNDRKIPKEHRDFVPIFCDDCGVLWIPGFSSRDGEGATDRKIYITLLSPISKEQSGKALYY